MKMTLTIFNNHVDSLENHEIHLKEIISKNNQNQYPESKWISLLLSIGTFFFPFFLLLIYSYIITILSSMILPTLNHLNMIFNIIRIPWGMKIDFQATAKITKKRKTKWNESRKSQIPRSNFFLLSKFTWKKK